MWGLAKKGWKFSPVWIILSDMNSIVAAAIQIRAVSNRQENHKKVMELVQKAAFDKAKLIVLPEHWNWLGNPQEKKLVAEPIMGPSIKMIQDLARLHQCTIIAGSIAEANEDKPPYNTTVIIHPDGSLGRVYRKIHLFDAAVAGGHKESNTTTPGNEVVVEGFAWGCIGLSICYDVRFPELYRQLASMGANILAVPANFTAFTGAPHWEVLIRARAVENQCFVIAADQTGVTGAGWEAHGHSMIVDPWGDILAMAGTEEGVVLAELNLDRVEEVRTKMPVHAHRKL